MLTSSPVHLIGYDVIDPDINYSDHLPILGNFECVLTNNEPSHKSVSKSPLQLRWDHADLLSYYQFSRIHLEPILDRVINTTNQFEMQESIDYSCLIEQLHNEIIDVLRKGADLYVPHHRANFYKYWWDQEMDALKTASIESNQAWKAAGKPRQGPIFEKRQKCRLLYRKKIRDNQAQELTTYSNDLHDALLAKRGTVFWKCWNSKFEQNKNCDEVDGSVDANIIADKFATFFSESYQANDADRASILYNEYVNQRAKYSGFTLQSTELFDAELMGIVIDKLSCGKAAGLDSLTAEHLKNCHPILSTILAKLFNLMLLCNRVPSGFFHSYTVPLPKVKNYRSKAMSCNDFRGIAISSILSKAFEHCILNRFERYLSTDDNQFGFKRGLGCTHAIYTVQNIVNNFIKGGSTVNICSLDLSKAFDKTNHHGLLIKLMSRFIPDDLLDTLDYWLSNSWSCIKWFNCYSHSFKISYGVRQGSVLSPFLFAIYLDNLVDRRANGRHWFVILYADDILIIASSICILQMLLHACERELVWLDLTINVNKSCCLRIGPRWDAKCSPIFTLGGHSLAWVETLKYLGIYITSFRIFKCSFVEAKRAYFRSLNAIFGKVGRFASEEVLLHLVASKCLPVLLYGTEACNLNKSDVHSLDFAVMRFSMKLFRTNNATLVLEILSFFNFELPSVLITRRLKAFREKYRACDNCICKMFVVPNQLGQ
jgi:Reverse transcriptase (RNA-dependent DNA polymerase)